jgi:hypothetical protein
MRVLRKARVGLEERILACPGSEDKSCQLMKRRLVFQDSSDSHLLARGSSVSVGIQGFRSLQLAVEQRDYGRLAFLMQSLSLDEKCLEKS